MGVGMPVWSEGGCRRNVKVYGRKEVENELMKNTSSAFFFFLLCGVFLFICVLQFKVKERTFSLPLAEPSWDIRK